MDFALSDEQQAIAELADRILTDLCAPEVLREVESGTDWFHRDLWLALAEAGLLGICLPESVGGGGYGVVEACVVLQEAGRAVAPIPLWSTLTAALAVAELGTDDQRRTWLPGVVDGSRVLAVALEELAADARDPQMRAERDGDGWRLTGTKTDVAALHLADAVLVPARLSGGVAGGTDAADELGLFLVPADAAGWSAQRQDTFNHEPHFRLDLDDTSVSSTALVATGTAAVDRVVDLATVGICAVASGVSDGGMTRTAAYVTERKQFDRPIGSFQAVGHRMADCYVDNESIRLTMLQAATRLASNEPADREVAVAKYWASYSGRRIGHADLHLHGGISIDLDYPIHRYFLWSKQLELTLGAASPQLARLGSLLAG